MPVPPCPGLLGNLSLTQASTHLAGEAQLASIDHEAVVVQGAALRLDGTARTMALQ